MVILSSTLEYILIVLESEMKSCIVVLSSAFGQVSNVLLPNRFSKQLSLKKMGSPGHRTKSDSFMQFPLGMKTPFLLTASSVSYWSFTVLFSFVNGRHLTVTSWFAMVMFWTFSPIF